MAKTYKQFKSKQITIWDVIEIEAAKEAAEEHRNDETETSTEHESAEEA